MLDVKDGIWGNPMSNITNEQWFDAAKKLLHMFAKKTAEKNKTSTRKLTCQPTNFN